jgi:hypothetical protein
MMRPPVPDQASAQGPETGHKRGGVFPRGNSERKTSPGLRLLYWLDPVDYLADLAHGAVGPLQLFPTSIVQRLAL